MKKTTRLLAALLAVVMLVPSLLVPGYADASFTDVKAGSWYEEAVNYVTEKGFMNGVGDGKFAPNQAVTRAMFVTVLARMFDDVRGEYANTFEDVPDGKWYTEAVAWAAAQGITNGVSATMFAPNKSITRQDMCTMLARYLNGAGLELPKGEEKTFTDSDKISGYAKEAVALCSSAGLILGNEDGSFKPTATATRAQLAIILMRLDKALHPAEEPVVDPTEPEETQPDVTEPDPTEPDANTVTFSAAAGDLNVNVAAPETALPANASMVVSVINSKQQLDEIAEKANGKVLAAVDISFHDITGEIEPDDSVEVTLTKAGLDASTVRVVHIKDDGTLEGVNNVTAEPNAVKFRASDFSVYAIIGEGEGGDRARLTVNFINTHLTGNQTVKTVYVKNADVLLGDGERVTDGSVQYIEDIVYDPGINEVLGNGLIFRGWSIDAADANPEGTSYGTNYNDATKAFTIEDIRAYIAARADEDSIHEGDVLNIYAMVFKVFLVSYKDQHNIILASDNVYCTPTAASAPYTVSQTYSATDDSHNFEGWNVDDGADHIHDATYNNVAVTAAPYKQNTSMNIDGNIVFSVNISTGNWLVFNENGKNATYNAPVFVKVGETAASVRPELSLPENMERAGYTFAGWFLSDPAPTPVGADPNGAEFNFNQELTKRTEIYAKWTLAESANYTVVVWKQKSTGGTDAENYDFSEAHTFTNGTPLTEITSVHRGGSSVTDANGTYQNVVVDGWKEITGSDYLGFHADRFDEDVEIEPNGTTVLNIYYNRNMVQLNFKTYGYTYTKVAATDISTSGAYYYVPDASEASGYRAVYLRRNGSQIQYDYYNGEYSRYDYFYWNTFTGDQNEIYTRSSSQSWNNYKTLTGLYGAPLGNNDWPANYRWRANGGNNGSTSGTITTFMADYLPSSTSMIVNFYGSSLGNGYTITFYQQDANLTTYTLKNTVNIGTTNDYTFYLTDKYTGFECASWSSNNGSTWHQVGTLDTVDGDLYYDADPNTAGHQDISASGNIQIRYDRLSYKITYLDGTYFDRQGVVEETHQPGFGESTAIVYGGDISAYGDSNNALYNKPSVSGYYFMGWYADSTCNVPYTFTTMPIGGVQVYAKWQNVQYRVFLHPNAGHGTSHDTTLSWGSATQQMNFRVDYGSKISLPTGKRDNYDFLGWFTDANFQHAYTVDSVLNDSTVPAVPEYNKQVDMTENSDGSDMDKWGDLKDAGKNGDIERPYVRRKLDLYAKWSKILPGASGIGVEYVGNGGSGVPEDTNLYKDNVSAVVQAAPSTAPAGKQFLYWVMQTWDGEKYVDLEGDEYHKYPGETFIVLEDNAYKVQEGTDSEGNPVYRYTVCLRAQWIELGKPTPSHIYWYANNGSGRVQKNEPLAINEAIDIPTPTTYKDNTGNTGLSFDDHTFLGWARIDSGSTTGESKPFYPVTKDDLWLKWENGKYYVNTNETGSGEPVWVETSQVAPDEKIPYQDLYAVWDYDVFYVFHSYTGELEAFEVPANGTTFNLVDHRAPGTYYTGWFSSCGLLPGGPSDEQKLEAEKVLRTNTLGGNADLYKATPDLTYDGSMLYINTETNELTDTMYDEHYAPIANVVRIWNKNDGIHTEEGTIGNALVPVEGNVYYLKELPTEFFQNKTFFVWDTGTEAIEDLYLFSAVDDRQTYKVGEDKKSSLLFRKHDLPKDEFYLVGYINGEHNGYKDYESNTDNSSWPGFKFNNDTLTMTFSQNSYVFVKTKDNEKYYMANGFPGETATSTTLYNTQNPECFTVNYNKLFVPGGVEVTFTLVVDEENDTVNLSYTTGAPSNTLLTGEAYNAAVASSAKIVQAMPGANDGTYQPENPEPLTVTAASLFSKLNGGMLMVAHIKGIKQGDVFQYVPEWTTLDGLTFQGAPTFVKIGINRADSEPKPTTTDLAPATRGIGGASRSKLVQSTVPGEDILEFVIELMPGFAGFGLD